MTLLKYYSYVVIANVIISWLVAFHVLNTQNRFVYSILDFTYRLTEPFLDRIRRYLPNLGAFDISHRTGIPILPVYLQYEAENAYEWGWEDNLPQHLFKLITAINKHTHCHIFNPIYPQNFSDAKSYQEYVFSLYKNWQQRFKLIDNEEESETVSYTGTALRNS